MTKRELNELFRGIETLLNKSHKDPILFNSIVWKKEDEKTV